MKTELLCIDTPRFTKYTRKELLRALNAKTMKPIMNTEDGMHVLIECNAILFFDLSKASREFTLHYYYLGRINQTNAPSRPSRKEFLPQKALVVRQLKDATYVYMGIANLTLLYTDKGSINMRESGSGYGNSLFILSASGEFIDVPTEEEVRKKYGAIDPKTYEVLSKAHYRSLHVAEYARKTSHGFCQLCGKTAPFADLSGRPYLEVHHVKWLSKGGSDTCDNVVALCPNCHSRMHVLDDPKDVMKLEEVIANRESTER